VRLHTVTRRKRQVQALQTAQGRGKGRKEPQRQLARAIKEMSARVRVSPISRTAAILIILVGVFVLFGGLVTGVLASDVAGLAFIVLGVALYRLLYRFTRKLRKEIGEAEKS